MDAIESLEMQPPMPSQILNRPGYGAVAGQVDGIKALTGGEPSEAKLKKLAKDFESVLLTKLFDQVQESIGGWDSEEQDGTSKQVQGLFWMHLSQDVADKGGIGLWREIYEHLQQTTAPGAAGEQIDEGL